MIDFLSALLIGSLLAITSSSSSQVTAFQTVSSSLTVPRKSTSSSSSSIWHPTTRSSIIKTELFAKDDDNDDSPFNFLTKLPDPFSLLKGDGDASKSSNGEDDADAFQPTPLGLVRQARRCLACDYGILDASLLDDSKFQWIGPFLDQPLTKVEYLAAGRFFDLRAAFPDLDYRPHDFRIDEQDSNTVRFTCRVTGTMRGALRLRTGILPPTGQVMKCPPEAVSMTFDPVTGKLCKLCTGFCMDRQVGNTRGATGVMAASMIAGEPPSDWDLYPATTVIKRFFGRPIRPLVEPKSVLAPFPETVMIQLAKGILATNMAFKDESLLADKFEFCSPYVGPVQKREFLEKYATKEFENIDNPSFSHFRVDPYDPVRVWVDVLPKSSSNNVNYSGAPQAMSFAFDDDGFCTRITSSYVMDPSIGNGGGLGGPEGYLYAMGKPSPVFLTRPYARIMGRVRKSILSPITGVGVDDYVSTTPRLERSPLIAASSTVPAKPQQPAPAKAPASPPKPATPIDKLASLRSLSNKIIPEPMDSTTKAFPSKPPEPVKKKTVPAPSPAAPKSVKSSTAAAPPPKAIKRSAPKKSPKLIVTAPSPSSSSSSRQIAADLEKVQRQKQAQQLEEAARRRQKEKEAQQQEEEARRRRQQEALLLEEKRQQQQRQALLEEKRQQQQRQALLEEKRQQQQRKQQAAEKEAQLRKRQEEEAAILAEKARAAAKARMAAAAEAKLRRVEQERLEAERQLELAQSGRPSSAAPPQVNQAQVEAAAKQKEAQEKARAKELAAEEKAKAKAKKERQQAALDAISRAMTSASISLFGLGGEKPSSPEKPAPPTPSGTVSLFGLGGRADNDSDAKKPKKEQPPPPSPRATISLKSPPPQKAKTTTKTAASKTTVTSSPTISLFGFGGGSTDAQDTPAKKVAAAKAATQKTPSSPSISLFGFGGGSPDANTPPPKKSSTAALAAKKKAPSVSSSPTISLFGYGGGGDSSTPATSQPKKMQAKKTPPPAANKKVTPVKKTAPMGVPTISRWKRNSDGSVTGNISGSPNFANGEKVTTSPISGGTVQSGEVVRTGSGSRYFLD